jgi:hypothetical protein
MSNTRHPSQYIVLLASVACATPLLVHAKDGRDNGVAGHPLTISAAACTEIASPSDVASARSGGAFTVRDGASTRLICALPSDELDHSVDRDDAITLAISYLDGDGSGAALVTVELVRTELAADPNGFADVPVCGWSSAAGGTLVGTTARVVCAGGLVDNGFYHIRGGLGSVPGSAVSFIGIVVHP